LNEQLTGPFKAIIKKERIIKMRLQTENGVLSVDCYFCRQKIDKNNTNAQINAKVSLIVNYYRNNNKNINNTHTAEHIVSLVHEFLNF